MNIDLEDPYDHDLALCFVEQELGRIDFLTNWSRLQEKERIIRQWLESTGENGDRCKAVVDEIDGLWNRKATWKWLK